MVGGGGPCCGLKLQAVDQVRILGLACTDCDLLLLLLQRPITRGMLFAEAPSTHRGLAVSPPVVAGGHRYGTSIAGLSGILYR